MACADPIAHDVQCSPLTVAPTKHLSCDLPRCPQEQTLTVEPKLRISCFVLCALLTQVALSSCLLANGSPRAAARLPATAYGSIHGIVTDARYEPVSDVTVEALGSQGVRASVLTNQRGSYTVGSLVPGPYVVQFVFRDGSRIERDTLVEADRPSLVYVRAPSPSTPGRVYAPGYIPDCSELFQAWSQWSICFP